MNPKTRLQRRRRDRARRTVESLEPRHLLTGFGGIDVSPIDSTSGVLAEMISTSMLAGQYGSVDRSLIPIEVEDGRASESEQQEMSRGELSGGPFIVGANQLVYTGATPGGFVAFLISNETGSFLFADYDATVDLDAPTIVAVGVADTDGVARAFIDLTAEQLEVGVFFQAFEMAPRSQTSKLLSSDSTFNGGMAPVATDFMLPRIPGGAVLTITADDLVTEFGTDIDSDLSAASISFGAVNNNPILSLSDFGFVYTPGDRLAGSFSIDTNASAYDGLLAGQSIDVRIEFSVTDGNSVDTGALTFSVANEDQVADTIDFHLFKTDVPNQELTATVAVGDEQSGIEVAAAGVADVSDLLSTVDFSAISLSPFLANGLSTIAIAWAADNATATAGVSNQSTAIAVANVNSAASAIARNGSDAGALAQDGSAADGTAANASSTTATANSASVATAFASERSSSTATSSNVGSATAFADSNSVANANASGGSISGAVSVNSSAASANSNESSDALALATNSSAAESISSARSSANAGADDLSDATATATGDSTAVTLATAESTSTSSAVTASVAFSLGFDRVTVANASAVNSSAARSAAAYGSEATASATDASASDAAANAANSTGDSPGNDTGNPIADGVSNQIAAIINEIARSKAVVTDLAVDTISLLENQGSVLSADFIAAINPFIGRTDGDPTLAASTATALATSSSLAFASALIDASAAATANESASSGASSEIGGSSTATSSQLATATSRGVGGGLATSEATGSAVANAIAEDMASTADATARMNSAANAVSSGGAASVATSNADGAANAVAPDEAITISTVATGSTGDTGTFVSLGTPSASLSGLTNTAIALPINVFEVDGVAIQSIVLSNLPAGSILSAGVGNADGTQWAFDTAPPVDLTLTPPTDFSGVFELEIAATNTSNVLASATHRVVISEMLALEDLDVSGEGELSARDALLVINFLARQDRTQGEGEASQSSSALARYDSNRDGTVTARDALVIINRLGRSIASEQTSITLDPGWSVDLDRAEDDWLRLLADDQARFSV